MPEVDPDQLLKELDAKLVLMRAKRCKPSGNNYSARIGVMVVICLVLIIFLWGVQMFLSQMAPPRNAPAPGPVQEHR
jgi:hypothetical protein